MARDTWVWVNGTQVFLDAAELRKGRLVPADRDVMSEQCEGCGEDILESGEVEKTTVGHPLSVTCSCGARFAIERS